MNNTKRVGILNSREDWESLIWRKQTVESVGMSASDLSPNYANLTVGSLLDQFDRFGLLKAIRAAGKHAEMHPSAAGSQYCAIFEGSNIYVDTSGASAIVYGTNRAVESWIPRVDPRLPVGGEQQRAQLAGWFMQPRQLDITNNIADRSAAFVAFPYGRESDAVRETIYVNKDGGPAEFNARISNLDVDVLKTTFSSPSGLWHLIGDARIEADNVDITGYKTTYVANSIDITSAATTLLGSTLDISASTRHVGQVDMTDNKIVNLAYADIDAPGDAVNVEFTRVVTPIGGVMDFGGTTAPANWLNCWGAATTISGFDKLFNVIGFNFGMMSLATSGGFPATVIGDTYVSVSGVPMLYVIANVNGGDFPMTGVIQSVMGGYQFVTGTVENVGGFPSFVSSSPAGITGSIDHFLLPNTKGRVSVGSGSTTIMDISGGSIVYSYTLGDKGGSNKHILTSSEMPNHNHTMPYSTGNNSPDSTDYTPTEYGAKDSSTTTGFTGGGLAHNNMMPYIVFNKIIRYK
jgi:microcystin-dependent protein